MLDVFHASADAGRWDLVDMVDVLSGLVSCWPSPGTISTSSRAP
ncbi:hypothetical protein [Amycolatopsis viridis]|uniref:Uncharacterized protein n=1 Tax=Amycolatopsis viridis TaxID=185678 RepID=A0ABX0STX0_9PSEU|nr:hypothetical protein [Amycolatopsis viridis]NIH79079.1 hypothetical protein [Amycolatopsis viridis]